MRGLGTSLRGSWGEKFGGSSKDHYLTLHSAADNENELPVMVMLFGAGSRRDGALKVC